MPRKRHYLAPEDSPIPVYNVSDNLWGRRSIPEMRPLVSNRDVRRRAANEEYLVHRPKNGIYDPITFYHLVEYLLGMRKDVAFRASNLTAVLMQYKPQFVWDPTSVGRIMNDLAESLNASYEVDVIQSRQMFDGKVYVVSSHPVAAVALRRLVDDLAKLARDMVEKERLGQPVKRFETPLLSCPSLVG